MPYVHDTAFHATAKLAASPPTASRSLRWKSHLLSSALRSPLDRVNVLGDSDSYTGHTGCVNALSWARNGEILLSGGDDMTVRLWRMDMSVADAEYPFVCDAVIRTGHRANIFNAQMLPHSSRIATVAGDRQVRISDIGDIVSQPGDGRETVYNTNQANVRILRCHSGRVKRIVTEDHPDLFLTVSEDGTVRQHDLRTPHHCQAGSCPAPLVRVKNKLFSLALSPLTPYQFVVAGESPHGLLFDRRHSGRHMREEWGMLPDTLEFTTCVRRLGRAARAPGESDGYEHVTGARMASSNGHEVLLSYSSDAVYLYSIHDEPKEPSGLSSRQTSVLSPNRDDKAHSLCSRRDSDNADSRTVPSDLNDLMEADIERFMADHTSSMDERESQTSDEREDSEDGEDEEDEEMEDQEEAEEAFPNVPLVMPRRRYSGICNVETVKDVNFLGPNDEFVVSGSDDGNFFIWDKATGRVHDVLEGDGHVVNVIEGHPHLPLVAVSGIDTTVKLFAPARRPSSFSRMQNVENIVKRNVDAATTRIDLAQLMIVSRLARRAAAAGIDMDVEQCRSQ